MIAQSPPALLMIRPASFGFNPQTADSNAFQKNTDAQHDIHREAEKEFDRMAALLGAHDVEVRIVQDKDDVVKPDAIFPNNWISFHADGTVILYPMMAENRRLERRLDVVEALKDEFIVREIIDLSDEEKQSRFLEGTGSLVFDHPNRVVYACHSPRTHEALVLRIGDALQYRTVLFHAVDEKKQPIYHTNVMMAVGTRFAVVCLDAIPREEEQDVILETLASTGHQIIAISFAQMAAFAGNMIEVQNRGGDPLVLLSETAFQSLLPGQINAIHQHAELLPIKIETIEKCGGGSVRCMVAGIHLPKRNSN